MSRNAFVRSKWLFEVATTFQRIVGGAMPTDGQLTLPTCRTTAEALILRGMAAEFALRVIANDDGRWDVERRRVLLSLFSRNEDVVGGLESFLSAVLAIESSSATAGTPHPLANRIREVVESSHGGRVTTAEVATRCAVSRRTVECAFRDTYGVSISEFGRRRRIDQAMRRLLDTDDKVSAIASDLGYRSCKNFYRAFRKATGDTPHHFRTVHRATTLQRAVSRPRGALPVH